MNVTIRLHLLTWTLALLSTSAVAQQDAAANDLPKDRIVVDTTSSNSGIAASALKEYNQAYYQLDFFNQGLPEATFAYNLQSPQATMEHFILSSRSGKFEEAAYALNLNLLPSEVQAKKAAILAEKLHYIIKKRITISWGELPDRPDGQIKSNSSSSGKLAGEARRDIRFGNLSLNGRNVPLRLQRVKLKDQAPFWVIAAGTTENIELLYQQHGPSQFERWVPEWSEQEVLGIALWKIVGLLLLGLICYLIARVISFVVSRTAKASQQEWLRDISGRIATPLALAVGCFLFYIGTKDVLSISGSFAPYFYSLLLIIVIGAVTWLIMRVIDSVMIEYTESQIGDVSEEENLQARRTLTYISFARRIVTFVVIVVGISIVLSQFPSMQSLGVSLMASAGLATIILGIAAQSTLGNIIAGLQIALTKAAKIGDSVLFEGEYGAIEDLRFTYLVIRTWDLRRVVVPLKYFITHPFENWSLNDPHMMKPIHLYLDYKVDVEQVRQKFSELLKAADNYDEENPPTLDVIDCSKEAIELRALCSAKDASTAWSLHCKLREQMVAYIGQLQDGKYLAKERVQLQEY
jgi:small-conductance mechanosensitive channel